MAKISPTSVVRRLLLYPLAGAALLSVLLGAQSCSRQPGTGQTPTGPFEALQRQLLGNTGSRTEFGADTNWGIRRALADDADTPTATHQPAAVRRRATTGRVAHIRPTDEFGRPNYVAGQLIVRFEPGVSRARREQLIRAQRATVLEQLGGGEYLIGLPAEMTVPEAAVRFGSYTEVAYAEPDILHYTHLAPNDMYYSGFNNQPSELQRWYYNGIGADRNLNAEAAWTLSTGRPDVIIAIIDTGVALEHPDLAPNIWTNPGEIPGNGVDDDGNGYIDDVYGWDFYFHDNDPRPDLGDGFGDANVTHGSFVAGCAAAAGNNGLGVTGASWHSRIMALKVFTDDGGAPASAIAGAIRYAARNGAHIVNMSFGSPHRSRLMLQAVNEAWSKGLLLVASAGNSNSRKPSYPAGYGPVLSVGGSGSGSLLSGNGGRMQARASFTQFGPRAVDVVAPAVDVVSTGVLSVAAERRGEGRAGSPVYFLGNGTSFSAPLVSGLAALVMSRARDLGVEAGYDNAAYRAIILAATVNLPDDPADFPDGRSTWDGRGRVDFLRAVEKIGPVTP